MGVVIDGLNSKGGVRPQASWVGRQSVERVSLSLIITQFFNMF